jgi:hypothetical protein
MQQSQLKYRRRKLSRETILWKEDSGNNGPMVEPIIAAVAP